jgi:hypothetical protein
MENHNTFSTSHAKYENVKNVPQSWAEHRLHPSVSAQSFSKPATDTALQRPTPYLETSKTALTKPIYFVQHSVVREAAELFIALSIIPSPHIAHPRRTARNSSHAISLTACGTMDKTLISNRLPSPRESS